ncbi:MAG: DNA-directed RNA polymerase subunit omega [Candidatus Omnitrophota bacterium]|nr:DNA-directed RNA polymerase subunit omega [Candidatus Omnitrophota bacterium]
MAYQPLERLLPQAGNSIYKLIIMSAQRSLELAEGMPKLIENPSSDKPTTIALEEVMKGKVKLVKEKEKK